MTKKTPPATLHVIDTSNVPKCECGHGKEMHYGNPANWCNTSNCECQGWEPC